MKRVQIIKAVAFLLIALITFEGLSSILNGSKYVIYWTGPVVENPLYKVPEDSLEVICLGPSSGMTSFSPLELYGEYGINAYNYCSESQAPIVSYYMLKEVIKQQKNLKVVLLQPQTLLTKGNYALARKVFDGMRLSQDKLNGIQELVELYDEDPWFSYLVPLNKFHARWDELNPYDFMLNIPNVSKGTYSMHNGFMMGFADTGSGGFYGFSEDTGTEVDEPLEEGVQYFTQIAELCRENGIDLILYNQPYSYNPEIRNTIQAFADSVGVPYLDFHLQKYADECGINWETDFGAHLSTGGAIKISRYLGKYLHDNYEMTDVRNDEKYQYLKDDYNNYLIHLENLKLSSTSEIDDYLSLLSNPRYSVFITAKDEASKGIQNSTQKLLHNLGLQKELQGHYHQAYLAVIESGNVVTEYVTENEPESAALQYGSALAAGPRYQLKSAGYSAGNIASIQIDDTEYAVNARGLNIVVYDNRLGKVIDSVSFDTYKNGYARRIETP